MKVFAIAKCESISNWMRTEASQGCLVVLGKGWDVLLRGSLRNINLDWTFQSLPQNLSPTNTSLSALLDDSIMSENDAQGELNMEIVLDHLQSLLSKRAHPKTLCPSEAARALSNTELRDSGAQTWRDLMPMLRILCFQLRDDGEVEILQRGHVIPLSTALEDVSGPIRVRNAGQDD